MSAVLSFSNRLADFCTSCFSSWRLDKWRWAADNFSAMSCCSEPTLSSLLVSSCSTSWCWITTWNKQLIQCITNFTQDTRSVRPGYVTLNRNLTSYHWLWQSNGTRHRTSKTEQALRYVTLRYVTLWACLSWVSSSEQRSSLSVNCACRDSRCSTRSWFFLLHSTRLSLDNRQQTPRLPLTNIFYSFIHKYLWRTQVLWFFLHAVHYLLARILWRTCSSR